MVSKAFAIADVEGCDYIVVSFMVSIEFHLTRWQFGEWSEFASEANSQLNVNATFAHSDERKLNRSWEHY